MNGLSSINCELVSVTLLASDLAHYARTLQFSDSPSQWLKGEIL